MTKKYLSSYLIVFITFSLASCYKICESPKTEPTPPPHPAPCLLPSLNTGLVAYYPFNGNASDESGYGHHAIFNNAQLTSDRYDSSNRAYRFNGVNSYMRIANSPDLNPQKISLCAIVKPMGFYKGRFHSNVILYKGFQDQDIPNVYFIRFNEGAGSVPTDPNGTIVDTLHQTFYGSFAGNKTMEVPPYIQANTWYKIVYTYDGTSAKFYVNGELVSSVNSTLGYQPSSQDIYLGRTINPNYPYWFNGVIDEIRIYNRALDINEVKSFGSACNAE